MAMQRASAGGLGSSLGKILRQIDGQTLLHIAKYSRASVSRSYSLWPVREHGPAVLAPCQRDAHLTLRASTVAPALQARHFRPPAYGGHGNGEHIVKAAQELIAPVIQLRVEHANSFWGKATLSGCRSDGKAGLSAQRYKAC